MRIALFGGVDQAWVSMIEAERHQVTSIWTAGAGYLGEHIGSLTARYRCPVFFHAIERDDLMNNVVGQADILISIGYPHRIPVLEALRGINIHPSMLPDGRGAMPIQQIIAEHPESAGVTIHKISHELDGGDIIAQERMELSSTDDSQTLLARTYRRSAHLTATILRTFDVHWKNASPQHRESRWTAKHLRPVEVDLSQSVEAILKGWRAYGPGLVQVRLEDNTIWPTDVRGWAEAHAAPPGEILERSGNSLLIAVGNGILMISHH